MGYIFIAKDNKKIYFWMEVVMSNVLWILCSLFFYYFYGLIGLGISLVARTLIDIVVSYIVCRRFYAYRVNPRVVKILAVSLLLGTAGFIVSLLPDIWVYIGLSVILAVSLLFSSLILRRALKASR